MKTAPTCWILTDGRTGSENHSRGLAEALGVSPVLHPIALNQPWKSLSPWLLRWIPAQAFRTFPDNADWPDLLITTGRTPAVGALYVRRASRGKTVCVQIMKPGLAPAAFDLVIVPQHDNLTGPNVLTVTGALHRITDAKLAEAKAVWQPRFAPLGGTFLAGLLVGGATRGLALDGTVARQVIVPFINAVTARGGRVVATCSRRTDPEAARVIRAAITQAGGFCWDGITGENPYFGILSCAHIMGVTADSVSMLSESAFTGRPLWMLPLPGHNAKLARFHQKLRADGHARTFEGLLEDWQAVPLRELDRILPSVREMLVSRGVLSG